MRSTEGLLLLKKERSLQHIVDNEAFALARFDFLKVVRLVFWSGAARHERLRSLALRARTIALRAHSRATRSKARLVSKSIARLVFCRNC